MTLLVLRKVASALLVLISLSSTIANMKKAKSQPSETTEP
jgi:hypothetical protein